MALVDSHAHLDSPRYDADREELLQRAWQQGVRTVLSIGIGDGPDTMQQALELSRSYAGKPGIPRVLATAGIHPHEAQLADQAALAKLDDLLANPDVLAVGEIGLDYYYDHSPRPAAEAGLCATNGDGRGKAAPDHHSLPAFRWQHQRMGRHAGDDRDQLGRTNLGGVLHCFTGEWEHARRALDCGFLISFAGNITFPRAENIREVAAKVPLDRMLIETDAPFLAPLPYRGKRNEPAWVGRVADKLAEVCGVTAEQVASSTANNFFRFFGVAPDAES